MKYILLCGGIGSRNKKYSLPKPLNYIVQQRTAGVSRSVITSDVRENIKSKLLHPIKNI